MNIKYDFKILSAWGKMPENLLRAQSYPRNPVSMANGPADKCTRVMNRPLK
jgi:hypothetical protein